jgi:hypothetical protein
MTSLSVLSCRNAVPLPGDNGSADADADADSDADTDTDTDTDGDTGSASDGDGDGFTSEQGDCDDDNALANPMAVESCEGEGIGADDDCDGEIDNCDDECGDCAEVSPAGMAQALAIGMEACDERFLILAGRQMSSPGGDVAFDLMTHDTSPCFVSSACGGMAALGTGSVAWSYDPNEAQSMGGDASTGNDPQPAYNGSEPVTAALQVACDVAKLKLTLRAPTNATGFHFDFVFGSAEYDEWVGMGYADTFYAIVEDPNLNGGAPTNIAFGSGGEEITVNSGFMEDPDNGCDETGTNWAPSATGVSGTTGWLRTTWGVAPGAEFALTFSIHDEGDCIYDSIVFIDGLEWRTAPVENGTTPRP